MDVLAGPRPEGTRRRAREASDTIAHISHRPMAITRLSNASMNHANQIISCARGARLAHRRHQQPALLTLPPSDSTPSPRCLGEKYSTVLAMQRWVQAKGRRLQQLNVPLSPLDMSQGISTSPANTRCMQAATLTARRFQISQRCPSSVKVVLTESLETL